VHVEHVEVCCSAWVMTICSEVQLPGSEMLQDALVATSLTILSTERKDLSLSEKTIQFHTHGLQRLREAFAQIISDGASGKSVLPYATIMTPSLTVLLVHKSWANFGSICLALWICYNTARGPEALKSKNALDNVLRISINPSSF
jgi:hypothetical protein